MLAENYYFITFELNKRIRALDKKFEAFEGKTQSFDTLSDALAREANGMVFELLSIQRKVTSYGVNEYMDTNVELSDEYSTTLAKIEEGLIVTGAFLDFTDQDYQYHQYLP